METTFATTAYATTAPWQSQWTAPPSSFYYSTGMTEIKTEAQDADSKNNFGNWCMVTLIGVLLLCALIFTIFAAVTLSRRVARGGTEDYDDELLGGAPGGGSSSSGAGSPPVVYVPRMPSPPGHVTPPPTNDVTNGPGGPVVPMTAPPAKPVGPYIPAQAFTVCTLVPGAEPLYFPDDGLCDYCFFDSLSLTPGSNGFAYANQTADGKRFVIQGLAGQKTRYGMSVDYRDVETFSNAFNTRQGKKDYESYWIYNVFDWGFLTIDELQAEARISGVGVALRTLKEMHEHSLAFGGKQLGTFLGIFMRTNQSCAAVSAYLRTIFAPTGVIILGHLSYRDSQRPDCVIMPPVNYLNPRYENPNVGYGHNLRDTMYTLAWLAIEGVQTSLSISITMQARRYKLKRVVQGQPLLYTDCEPGVYEQRTTAQEICDDPNSAYSKNIRYDDYSWSLVTYNETDGYAITFENEISLRRKLCGHWSPEAVTFRVGVAVYDANYDRRYSQCDRRFINGTWSRFRFLLRLRTFLHQDPPSANFGQECARIT